MGLLGKIIGAVFNRPYTKYWLLNSPYDEIEAERERLRKPAFFEGDSRARSLVDLMDSALLYRRNKEYNKDHPNSKPVHHEHGWYLEGDD